MSDEQLNKPTHITPSDKNVLEDLGFNKEEVAEIKQNIEQEVEEVSVKKPKAKPRLTISEKNARKRRHMPGPAKKKKRITSIEKMRVLELAMENKTIMEIANALDRTVPTVTKILNELREKTKVAFGDQISLGINDEMVPVENYVESGAFSRIVNKLVSEGLTTEIARARVIKVFVAAQNSQLKEVNELEVYQAAQNTVSGKEIFSRKTEKGKSSVVAMNTGASERGDSLRKKSSDIQDHIDNQRIFKVN